MQQEALFATILKDHKDKIYRICYAYLYDREEVDDLYQEILINIWNSLPSFRQEAKLTTWMYRVAVNTAIAFNKKNKKYRSLFRTGELPEHADSHVEKSNKIELENKISALHDCIHQLPPEERLLIGLLLEDLTYKEIAEIAGLTVNHVGVKINRIKKKMAQLLND